MEPRDTFRPDKRRAGQEQSEGNASDRKRSLIGRVVRRIGWLAGGPTDWFGRKSVSSGVSLIGELWKGMSTGVQRDTRFKTDDQGRFDLKATAFSYGISEEVLEQRLDHRRRVTFMVSYGALLIALCSVIFWIHSAINQPYALARVMMAWEFLPFVGLFLLVAFYHALLNFQIRVRRSASWRDFLATEDGFLPK